MMKRRFLSIVLALLMLLSCLPAQADAGMSLIINGEEAAFADEQGNPLDNVLVEGRLHVPVVALGRYLGLDIAADAAAKTITLAGKPLPLSSGGAAVELVVIDGVVYAPVLAFVSALDDCTVDIVGGQYHINVKGATQYKQALEALRNGEYEKSRSLFEQSGNYADAAGRIAEAWYCEAEALLKQGQYDAASESFKHAGSYRDAAARVNEPYYVKGQKLQAEGKWTEATAAYASAGDYADAAAQAAQALDQAAAGMISSGDYKSAYAIFAEAGSTEKIRQLFYLMAQAKKAAGETEAALACYEAAGDYQDAKMQIMALGYENAVALEAAGKTEDAIAAYKAVGDYQDARAKWQQMTYDLARNKQSSEKYDEAYALYDTIRGYSDVDDRLKNSSSLKNAGKRVASAVVAASVQVGDIFTFGSYVHVDSNNKNKQPIQWEVLKKDGNKIMVLARYALAKKPFHSSNSKSINWSNCSLRTWLNGTFMNSAFTETERKAIVSTEISYKKTISNTAKCKDKVFLLSVSECNAYSKVAKDVHTLAGKEVYVWLRDRNLDWAENKSNISLMGPYGHAYSDATASDIYVRPAMWLNLESNSVDWSKYIKAEASANKYAVIERLIAAGKYQDALTKLGKEKTNAEVTRLIRECRYQMGLDALLEGKIITAREHFYQPSKAGYKHAEALINIIDSIR